MTHGFLNLFASNLPNLGNFFPPLNEVVQLLEFDYYAKKMQGISLNRKERAPLF